MAANAHATAALATLEADLPGEGRSADHRRSGRGALPGVPDALDLRQGLGADPPT
jgi:hypothetical protein